MRIRFAVIGFVLTILVCNAAVACGPFFPYAYFAFARERDVLKLPEASFYAELCRVLDTHPKSQTWEEAEQAREDARNADVNGLIESLKSANVSDDAAAPIIESYRTAREQDPPTADKLHESLPREFALYAEGAALYHTGNFDQAVAKWKELLALPAEQRRYKSVWAAYMIGRALRDTDIDQANAAFDQARAFAADGLPDPLDLAGESLGWQGYMDYNDGNTASAILRYAEQFKAEGPSADTALASLRLACGSAFESADALVACSKDETCRAILTAWVVSHPASSSSIQSWLSAVVAGDNLGDLPQADALAWAAYNAGDFNSARKLLDIPSAATPYGQWVRCKLLLRDGKIDDAVALMRETARSFPTAADFTDNSVVFYDENPPALTSIDAELGVLLLGREEYVDSFDHLLHAGFWLDAAYVGERVLTIDELKKYVDDHANDPGLTKRLSGNYFYTDMGGEQEEGQSVEPTLMDVTRYMLARRLARTDVWDEALAYLPYHLAGTAKELTAALQAGRAGEPPSTTQSYWEWFIGAKPHIVVDRDRAQELFTAATQTREQGMELLGTEVQPDWHVFGGDLSLSGYFDSRVRWHDPNAPKDENEYEPALEKLPEETERVLSASEDELKRVRDSAPIPDRRFHYRAVAADLMWQSAQLLPNNDLDTMRALYTGGQYLISMGDYLGANKYYRSLVWRNLNIPYAHQADKRRWFPETPPE